MTAFALNWNKANPETNDVSPLAQTLEKAKAFETALRGLFSAKQEPNDILRRAKDKSGNSGIELCAVMIIKGFSGPMLRKDVPTNKSNADLIIHSLRLHECLT